MRDPSGLTKSSDTKPCFQHSLKLFNLNKKENTLISISEITQTQAFMQQLYQSKYKMNNSKCKTFIFDFILLVVSSLISSPAFAFSPEERACYARAIEYGYENKLVLVASSVAKTCGCVVESEKNGITPENCKSFDAVTEKLFRERLNMPEASPDLPVNSVSN
jgi:hypothetical protein